MIQQINKSPGERRSVFEVFEVTDPTELAAAEVRREHFDRNSAWFQAHIREVGAPERRGKFLCIAGEEAFFGETVEDAVAQATAAHPDDLGWFTRYIPREKVARVYAN